MKKLTILWIIILISLLASCAKNNVKPGTSSSSWTVSSNTWEKIASLNWKVVKVEKKNMSKEIKKELEKEFRNYYTLDDSNHYENSCYIFLDKDLENEKITIYRNKWVWIKTWDCILNWVEKVWVIQKTNWKEDKEYNLKSYKKEEWTFKYVISPKYKNIWSWENEYIFVFHLKNGKKIRISFPKKFDRSELEISWLLKILKEKECIWSIFDISKIPTKSWESIPLLDWCYLSYLWNNEYSLYIELYHSPIYNTFIKNNKIKKEWFEVCWKLLKNRNIITTGNLLLLWDPYWKTCKLIDISSWFKYSGYYCNWKFTSKCKNSAFKIDNSECEYNIEYNSNNKEYIAKSYLNNDKKFIIKKVIYGSWFLYYTKSWNLVKICHWADADWDFFEIYRTFINWKDVSEK